MKNNYTKSASLAIGLIIATPVTAKIENANISQKQECIKNHNDYCPASGMTHGSGNGGSSGGRNGLQIFYPGVLAQKISKSI